MTDERPREDKIREAAARLRRAAANLESVAAGADNYLPDDAENPAIEAAIEAEGIASDLRQFADEISVTELDDELDMFFDVAQSLLKERGRTRTGAVAIAKEAVQQAKANNRDDFIEFLTTDRARAWLKKNKGG